MGQPVGFALQSCVLADRIGRKLVLGTDELGRIYHQSLLRYIGCNAETHTMAALFGDEINFRRDFARIDPGRASEMASLVFSHLRHANRDAGLLRLVGNVVRGLAVGPKIAAENIAGHCEVAQQLAGRLGLDGAICRNLGQLYERWDGRGLPLGVKGSAIAIAVRVVALAQDIIVLLAAFGQDAMCDRLRTRRGTAYDPTIVEAFLGNADELLDGLPATSWETVLELEPRPHAVLSNEEFDTACLAMADFADLKSPYSVGHSRALAALVREAARACGLPADDVADIYRAGLLHDIGQVAIPARVWLKASDFDSSDWEQVRLHAYYGERVLSHSASLSRLGAIVSQHHEHCDGSGYHRGARGGALSIQGRLLAAAEAYQNKIEARPHRPALSADAAAGALKRAAREGRLDADAVRAVLSAAGHVVAARRQMVHGLTAREIDVLRAIARGQSMKEIARDLGISPKTVENHAQSIYGKIDVKTRGGATLFAIEHGLCDPA